MSTRRAAASEAQRVPQSEADSDDVDMEDRPLEVKSDVDAEGEPEGDDARDMFQTIGDLSSYLCSVEEE